MPELRFLLKIGISFANEYFVYQNFHLKDVITNCELHEKLQKKSGNPRFRKELLDFHKSFRGVLRLLNNSNKTS